MVLKAATAVGHTCYGDPRPKTLDAAVEGLFEVATSKAEEVQFAVGEALCHIFGGDRCSSQRQSGCQTEQTHLHTLREGQLWRANWGMPHSVSQMLFRWLWAPCFWDKARVRVDASTTETWDELSGFVLQAHQSCLKRVCLALRSHEQTDVDCKLASLCGSGAPITPDVILRTSYSGLAKWLTATDGGQDGGPSALQDAQPPPAAVGMRSALKLVWLRMSGCHDCRPGASSSKETNRIPF